MATIDTAPDADKQYTLVTGASSGIGREIALRLSSGRRLILHGRDLPRLEETRSRAAFPERHLIWQHDLADVEGLMAGLTGVLAPHGIVIDAFVHCAGMLKILPIRLVNHKVLTEVLNVNFVSAAEIVSLLVKRRNREQLANIVFISSISSKFGVRGFGMYSASKGALDSLMRSLAVELAPRVRVNSILAGGIRTPAASDLLANPETAAKYEDATPLGTGHPQDVADMVEFLLSTQSRWVTGQQIVLDGGRTVDISV